MQMINFKGVLILMDLIVKDLTLKSQVSSFGLVNSSSAVERESC